MRVRSDGPQLISQMISKYLNIDCSVLMGANIAGEFQSRRPGWHDMVHTHAFLHAPKGQTTGAGQHTDHACILLCCWLDVRLGGSQQIH